ncbi:DsrB protein [Klebsiella pneumoniae]|uniref:Protein DsrB n=4 Tax=Klebsiella pneumoniae TaxID=573 RepID=A0A378G2M7_KLEPN|nr:DsrB protein [Klebsiella pneumoniae]
MQVNDRVTVKTDGGPRRSGVVLAIESFSEGTMYLVSLEDYPLGIWFFNEIGHPDGISWKKRSRKLNWRERRQFVSAHIYLNTGGDVFGQPNDMINHLLIMRLYFLFNIAFMRRYRLRFDVHLR